MICTNCKKSKAIPDCDFCDPCLGAYEGHCQGLAQAQEDEANGELWDEHLHVYDGDMGSPEANESMRELRSMLR